MKTLHSLKAAIAVIMALPAANAQTPLPPPPITNNIALIVDQFDTTNEVSHWRYDFGTTPTFSWDSTVDAGSSANAGSGAMKIVIPPDAANSSSITYDFAPAPGMDLSDTNTYATIALDVLVGQDSPVDYGNIIGNFTLAIRQDGNYDWESEINTNALLLYPYSWIHFQTPLTPTINQTRAFTLQMYRDASQAAGTTTYWVDNIVILGPGTNTGPPPPPASPTIVISLSSGIATFSWSTMSGHNYQLQSASSVAGPYTAVGSSIAGTGGTVQSQQTIPTSGMAFFRVQAQ